MTRNGVAPTPARSASLLKRLRYRLVPDHYFGELFSKPWVETLVPALIFAGLLILFAFLVPGFFRPGSIEGLGRIYGEYVFLAIGQAVVILAGGIDLSVGSIFALCNYLAIILLFHAKVHVLLVMPIIIGIGALVGSINGFLIGIMRLPALLTTLVMLILVRALVDFLALNQSGAITDPNVLGGEVLDVLGDGDLLNVPTSLLLGLILAVCAHVVLTRTRLGWHISAVGGARHSAFNIGINVRRVIFLTYVASGALTGVAAMFFAARLTSASMTAGAGIELIVISGVLLGGVSLGGGRGSIAKALLGTIIILSINSALLRSNIATGGISMAVGAVLLVAVGLDMVWNKYRQKVLNARNVAPTLVELRSEKRTSALAGGDPIRVAVSDMLGRGVLTGASDIVFAQDGNAFVGTRSGDIFVLSGERLEICERYVRTGGRPIGMNFDRDGNLVVCLAGMGLFRVSKQREVEALSTQTRRGHLIIDDTRVKMAHCVGVGPDNIHYYTDASGRFGAADWLVDAVEGRATGRLIAFDPGRGETRVLARGLRFPYGVCLSRDGQSLLIAETWGACVSRYWLAGPRRGTVEPFVTDLPGYPGSIGPSSDGHYWLPMTAMRSPAFELSLRLPDFRKRMLRQVAPDNWLMPNVNAATIVKIGEAERSVRMTLAVEDMAISQISSVREHAGKLYVCGANNDGVAVLDLSKISGLDAGTGDVAREIA
jgi:ribose transport system permease protein